MVNFCIFSFLSLFVLNRACNFSQKIITEKNVNIKSKKTLTSKGYTIEKEDGAFYIQGVLIANKTYPLSKSFYPKNTYATTTSETNFCTECIDKEAYSAYEQMLVDAKNENPDLNIWIQSGYRSYNYQARLYDDYVRSDGKIAADTYSSRPGYSEHQTGLAFDLNSVSDEFTNTPEGIWINNNCYKYGFIIRFPLNKEEFTGYKYESWHLRYVGKDLALKLYNGGDWISLEEYFGITSKYKN